MIRAYDSEVAMMSDGVPIALSSGWTKIAPAAPATTPTTIVRPSVVPATCLRRRVLPAPYA